LASTAAIRGGRQNCSDSWWNLLSIFIALMRADSSRGVRRAHPGRDSERGRWDEKCILATFRSKDVLRGEGGDDPAFAIERIIVASSSDHAKTE
jgi:hypothetical protein